jgi:hypothetical protein
MAKTQHFTNVQAGLPIYVLLLSGNNCLMYSSIGISFKSIKKENEIGTWKLDLLALHKIRRKVKTSHT